MKGLSVRLQMKRPRRPERRADMRADTEGMHQTIQFERNKSTGIAAINGATKKTIDASPVACEWKIVENETACCGTSQL